MNTRYLIGLILVIFGLSALLGINIGRFIGPVFIILLGLLMVTGKKGYNPVNSPQSVSEDSLNETYVFSGTEKKIESKDFHGGKIVAVFGGANIDLSQVAARQKVIPMELVAVFGAVQLKVPKNWSVVSEAAGIVGGIDNKVATSSAAVKLHIKGAAVFGGIEIRN